MAGSANLFDAQWLTAPSEYDSRYGTPIDTLQLHHATMISLPALIGMMMPGGREVSANGAMGNDGTLYEVVPLSERAFTSGSTYDRRCLTVECCNTTVDANWGISDETHRRAGKLAADMFRAGLLGALTREFIIGHREVPGTYATACPGPSFNLDLVVQYAREDYYGSIKANPKGIPMFAIIREASTGWIFAVGEDGRRAPIQNDKQYTALRRLRDAMFYTGEKIEEFYLGDFTDPAWGDLDRILRSINGPYTDIKQPAPTWAPTPAELAAIGAAAKPDVSALLKDIDKLTEADKNELLAAINKPRTVQ